MSLLRICIRIKKGDDDIEQVGTGTGRKHNNINKSSLNFSQLGKCWVRFREYLQSTSAYIFVLLWTVEKHSSEAGRH